MLPEVFVTDVKEATIFTEVMIRMGQEAPPIFTEVMTRTGQETPPFVRKFWYGCGDRKHRFNRSYVLYTIESRILTETGTCHSILP